jgi:nitrogen fixation protein FixH
MTDFIPQEVPFTGRKMLLIIVTFFGVIIAVNGTMLTLAVKTFGGLVVSNSYVASQSFNDDIATAKSQPIRGWSLDLATDADTVTLILHDRDGSALSGLELLLQIARPTHGRSTVTVPLSEMEPGKYSGKAVLAPGQWLGTIFTADGQTRSLTFIHAKPNP